MTMKRMKLTSPGVLFILAVIAAGGIFLLDVFYLSPRVVEQEMPALREQFAKAQRTVDMAARWEKRNVHHMASGGAELPQVRSYLLNDTTEIALDAAIRQIVGARPGVLTWLTAADGSVRRAWQGGKPVDADCLHEVLGDPGALFDMDPAEARADELGELVVLATGPAVASRADVVDTDDPERIHGGFYLVVLLGEAVLQNMSETVGGEILFVPAEALPAAAANTESTTEAFWKSGEDDLVAAWMAYGASGKPVGYYQAKIPVTHIRRQAVTARRMVLICLSLSLGLTFLVIMGAHILIGGPVVRLLGRLQQIESGERTTGDLARNLHGEPLMLARRLESAFERLAHISKTDQLTNLANRRHFEEVLDHFYEQAKRYNRPLSLAAIDLDFFKAVNDTAGHAAGDELLKTLSAVIEEACRKADLPARLGGDEFAVLFPETSADDAAIVLERIRQAICAEPLMVKNLRLSATISVGVTDLNAGPIDSPSAMLALADRALYAAKENGRNRLVHAKELDGISWETGGDDQQAAVLYQKVAGLDTQFKTLMTSAIEEIVEVLGDRDPYLADHCRHVQHYAEIIAREMELPERVVKRVRVSAMLHDIGMLAMPDSILLGPEPLTDEQRAAVRRHPLLGVQVMEKLAVLEQEIPAVRYHHERFDGKGYPEGIAGSAIPLTARILAVADAFDAMTSPANISGKQARLEALEEVRNGAGTQFDPNVVESFLAAAEKLDESLMAEPGVQPDQRGRPRGRGRTHSDLHAQNTPKTFRVPEEAEKEAAE
jgi:diguanylate cyclase (GGDEF)-like protein